MSRCRENENMLKLYAVTVVDTFTGRLFLTTFAHWSAMSERLALYIEPVKPETKVTICRYHMRHNTDGI